MTEMGSGPAHDPDDEMTEPEGTGTSAWQASGRVRAARAAEDRPAGGVDGRCWSSGADRPG